MQISTGINNSSLFLAPDCYIHPSFKPFRRWGYMYFLRIAGISFLSVIVFMVPVAQAKSVFLLQLGSFKTAKEAEEYSNKLLTSNADILKNLSLKTTNVTLQPDNYEVYRTQAGPVSTRAEANRLCSQLKADQKECFVVETAMFSPDNSTKIAKVEEPAIRSVPETSTKLLQEEPSSITLPSAEKPGFFSSLFSGSSGQKSPVATQEASSLKAEEKTASAALPAELPEAKSDEKSLAALPALAETPPVDRNVKTPPAQTASAPLAKGGTRNRTSIEPEETKSNFAWLFPSRDASAAAEPEAQEKLDSQKTERAEKEPVANTEIASIKETEKQNIDPGKETEKGFFESLFSPSARAETSSAETPGTQVVDSPSPDLPEPPVASIATKAPEPRIIPQPAVVAEAPLDIREPDSIRPSRNPDELKPASAEPERSATLAPSRYATRSVAPAASRESRGGNYTERSKPKPLLPESSREIRSTSEETQESNSFRKAKVSVSEAVRVPLSDKPRNVYVQRRPPQPAYYAMPSENVGIKSLWAQIGSFNDEPEALQYWDRLAGTEPNLTGNVRIRVTRPFTSAYRPNSGVSLKAGPYADSNDIRRLCEYVITEGLRCSMAGDLGSSATAGTLRERGYSARNYQSSSSRDADSDSEDSYWVQFGTYSSRSEAEDVWESIKAGNKRLLGQYKSFIKAPPMGSNSRALYRLRTGPFANGASASNLCGRLEGKGVDCIVVAE